MRFKIVVVIISIVYLLIVFNRSVWKTEKLLNWDKAGYYIYLPAVFIYDDLDHLAFYQYISEKYMIAPDKEYWAMYPQKQTGKILNKFPIGVSILQAPFFFIAHLTTVNSHEYAADGFSAYYQLSVYISSIFWCLLGFVMLHQLLRRYYRDKIVCIVILLLGFGTNLYVYTAFEAGMSHPYSFALFCIALNYIDLFYNYGKSKHVILAGLTLGLITIIRPTNIIIALVLLLWKINTLNNFRHRIKFLFINKLKIWGSALIFLSVLIVQFAYWKHITGHWIYYSYQEEGFNFLNPEIWKGLFSYRKGWFIYTPLAIVSILGLIPLAKKKSGLSLGIALYLVINIYVVFSWHQWYYGGGFGARALIESFAILSIPLAAFIEKIDDYANRKIKVFAGSLLVAIVSLNIFQTYQYSMGILPWDQINKEYYWRVFGRLDRKPGDWELLHFKE